MSENPKPDKQAQSRQDGTNMDDQRDYAEERANEHITHDPCDNRCNPPIEHETREAYEAFLSDLHRDEHLIGVEIGQPATNCDLLDELHELLGPCTWGVRYQ